MLAKHVADASWAQLAAMLDYKAARAGVEFVRVDPRGTSQQCPPCGQVAAKALDQRRHRCDCGADIDRDVAAAMVVHFRAFGFWPGAGLEPLSGSPPSSAQKPSPAGDGSSPCFPVDCQTRRNDQGAGRGSDKPPSVAVRVGLSTFSLLLRRPRPITAVALRPRPTDDKD